jgi:predicted DNA-binding transcriptional regulator AlpA
MNTNDKAAPIRNATQAGEHVLPQDNPQPGQIYFGPRPPVKKNSELPSGAQHPGEPAVVSESLHLEGSPPGVADPIADSARAWLSSQPEFLAYLAQLRGSNTQQSKQGMAVSSTPFGTALTLEQVAARCGANRSTVYRWRYLLPEDERLKQVKINGHRRVWESQLAEFLARHSE